jgi:hypothetical protein
MRKHASLEGRTAAHAGLARSIFPCFNFVSILTGPLGGARVVTVEKSACPSRGMGANLKPLVIPGRRQRVRAEGRPDDRLRVEPGIQEHRREQVFMDSGPRLRRDRNDAFKVSGACREHASRKGTHSHACRKLTCGSPVARPCYRLFREPRALILLTNPAPACKFPVKTGTPPGKCLKRLERAPSVKSRNSTPPSSRETGVSRNHEGERDHAGGGGRNMTSCLAESATTSSGFCSFMEWMPQNRS